jgi:hypothetical protein
MSNKNLSQDSEMFETPDGNKFWKNRAGKWHRLDGPAIEYSNGTKYWFNNGLYHRIDGPAIEYATGTKAYYLMGKIYPKKEAFFDALTDEEKLIALFSKDFHNA